MRKYTVVGQHWDSMDVATVEASSPEGAAVIAAEQHFRFDGEFLVFEGEPITVNVVSQNIYAVRA